jgi:hypothetical protein
MQVTLDSTGAWADLKEISELRRADRKTLNKAITFALDSNGKPIVSASLEDDMTDAAAGIAIRNWSLQLPVPSQAPQALDALTLEQDTNLREALAPYVDALQGKAAPVRENEAPTPASAS